MNSVWKTALLLAAGVAGISWASAAQQEQQPAGMAPPPRVQAGPRRKISLKEAMQLTGKQGPGVAAARALAGITPANIRKAWTNRPPNAVAPGQVERPSAPAIIG